MTQQALQPFDARSPFPLRIHRRRNPRRNRFTIRPQCTERDDCEEDCHVSAKTAADYFVP